jgi:hypothetical protein
MQYVLTVMLVSLSFLFYAAGQWYLLPQLLELQVMRQNLFLDKSTVDMDPEFPSM